MRRRNGFVVFVFTVAMVAALTVGTLFLSSYVLVVLESESTNVHFVIWAVTLLITWAWVGSRVGYRWRDVVLLLIPVWGTVTMVRWAWRASSLPYAYWTATAVLPGWYRDWTGTQRWWDGNGWTAATRQWITP